jgi:non-ribosomal peptide synthetase component F
LVFQVGHFRYPFAAFFSVYNLLLHKCSTQNSFVVGTAVTQRSVAQLQEVTGPFANTLPIRTTLDDEMRFAEYS